LMQMPATSNPASPTCGAAVPRPHPRTVGWFGTTSVAMGGINQSLFLIGALFIGQGAIPGQGSAAEAEFQKILDHSGIVWNCWTGALAHLGVARANGQQARISKGADSDAARVRALAAYKDFLALWKDADPNIPVLQEAKAEFARLQ